MLMPNVSFIDTRCNPVLVKYSRQRNYRTTEPGISFKVQKW